MSQFELYGSSGCPYTAEMRDWLDWRQVEYVEYDVDADTLRQNLRELLDKLTENGLLAIIPSDVGSASTI